MIDNSNFVLKNSKEKINKTLSANEQSIDKSFFIIDATDCVLGRLASYVASIMSGKHRPYYTRHSNCGDKVIIINAEKILLTGKKFTDKLYYWHTGYTGSLKKKTPKECFAKQDEEFLIKNAVKGMIKKGPLGYKIIKNLFIYKGTEHKHHAQKPILIDFKSINSKNSIRS